MLKQGVHPKVVQERLGHSTIAITLDPYFHVAPGLQEAAARRFDEAISSKVAKRLGERVKFSFGRGVRVVYGDGLENRCSRKGTVGSNPTPSAILKLK